MEVTISDGATEAVLSQAILIYTSKDRYGSQRKTVFASVHDVSDVGTKAKPNVQILPGTPVSREGLMRSIGSLAEEYLFDIDLLPENILGYSPKHMMWWRPAGNARVFFNNKELGQRAAVVPHPALVFIIIAGAWHVYALAESERPTMKTPLFHAPYFNVYDDGKICVGSAAVPDRPSPSSISTWEDAFFDSQFTHVNGHIRKVGHARGEYAFWKEMLDGKHKTFPTDLLVDCKKTVSSLLKPLRGVREGTHG